jgi:hypothetical protein
MTGSEHPDQNEKIWLEAASRDATHDETLEEEEARSQDLIGVLMIVAYIVCVVTAIVVAFDLKFSV